MMATFATELRRQLDASGISQNTLARRCGVSPAFVSRLLQGQRQPFRPTVAALAGALSPGDTAADAQRRHRLWLAAGLVPSGMRVTGLEPVEAEKPA
jgi:transcriptional regulator with XRE-family HTH domain